MIPSAKPFLGREEVLAARDAILSGWVTQGPKVKEFEGAFAQTVGTQYACAVSSGTSAIHLALRVVGVKPGDAVITVSHSFIASANCIRYCGAEPIFLDIDLETYNISYEKLVECLEKDCESRSGQLFYKKIFECITGNSPLRYLANGKTGVAGQLGRVSAILVVHQMGMPCDLGRILPLARRFALPVVEDAACALGSEIKRDRHTTWEKIGKPHGDLACFSFHPLKVLTTGEGGMITTNCAGYDRKLRLLRHQGMSLSDLERHRSKRLIVEEYRDIGFNYRMSDIQAAIGLAQLKKLKIIVQRRRELASRYQRELSEVSWLKLPEEPNYCKTNWQSFPVRLLDNAPMNRNGLIQYLRQRGVLTRLGIMNAHQEKPYFRRSFSLKNSETARNTVMILPLFHTMREPEFKKVIRLIKSA